MLLTPLTPHEIDVIRAYIIGGCTVGMLWLITPQQTVVERIASVPAQIEPDPQCHIIGSMREDGRSVQLEHMDCVSRSGETNSINLAR